MVEIVGGVDYAAMQHKLLCLVRCITHALRAFPPKLGPCFGTVPFFILPICLRLGRRRGKRRPLVHELVKALADSFEHRRLTREPLPAFDSHVDVCRVQLDPKADPPPIEQAFAKIKALLRKAAARTLDALEIAIAAALDAFKPDECANYFTNSGYEPD